MGSIVNDMFINGKTYIIDSYIAYLGSLNFTESGTKYNYETKIRITDIEAIIKIEAELDALYDNPDWTFFGIEVWGCYLNKEAIN